MEQMDNDLPVGRKIKTLAELIRELSERLLKEVSTKNGNPGNNQEAGE